MSYWLRCLNGGFVEDATLYALYFWNATYLGSKVTTKELSQGGGREALKVLRCAALRSLFNHCGESVSGKFREKASILHKIAKKKCQVEDSEKANGVASRSGKKLCDLLIYAKYETTTSSWLA